MGSRLGFRQIKLIEDELDEMREARKHTISKITIDNPSPHDRFTIGFATLIVSGN